MGKDGKVGGTDLDADITNWVDRDNRSILTKQ